VGDSSVIIIWHFEEAVSERSFEFRERIVLQGFRNI
jgi:hypothetical protein